MGHHLEETFSLCKIRVESAYTGCEGRVVPLLYGRRGHAVRLSEVMGKAFARCILCFDFVVSCWARGGGQRCCLRNIII